MQIQNTWDAIRLLFRKDKTLYRAFYSILGFYPHRIQYYQEALIHSSMAVRGEKGKPLNNERLEYLGDAVLETVASEILYHHFPNKREGFLTNARSKMVQRETLGRVAKTIGLDKLIRHQNTKHSHNDYMAGNALEALIGAIYLDRGYDYCMYFMQNRIIGKAMDLEKTAYVEVNFKSRILELCQKYRLQLTYSLLAETRDEAGAPYFRSSVTIEDEEIACGEGYSKRESQQQASKAAIRRFKKEPSLLVNLVNKKKEQNESTTEGEQS